VVIVPMGDFPSRYADGENHHGHQRPSGCPQGREVSFLLVQADAAPRRGLTQVLAPMFKALCRCAYCGSTVDVSAWSFIPSGYSEDLECPSCHRVNDISCFSRLLSSLVGLAAVLAALALIDHLGGNNQYGRLLALPFVFVGFIAGGMLSRTLARPTASWCRRGQR
jgi:hypothetical protein